MTSQDVLLYIDGQWCEGRAGQRLPVDDPGTGRQIGTVAQANVADLDRALAAAARGFALWKKVPAFERYHLMRRAASFLRERVDSIAITMTTEQGKPLAEARGEVLAGADTIDWFAEEARRTYGRSVPARVEGVQQLVVMEPVGPVAAFTPWNFPINQAVRKVSAALATGCSVILKGPEETPGSCAALVQAYVDAGLPAGVLNLVFGVPAIISAHLVPHPVIRKISFTGSTSVGKQLAMLAGQHMKRATMELGGHAPAIVFDDADLPLTLRLLSTAKFRNAGQVCTSPTRLLVQRKVFDRFVDGFVAAAGALKVGHGLEAGTQMGPLAHPRRVAAVEGLVDDAVGQGARLVAGGQRLGSGGGCFYAPTVLVDVPLAARLMNEEPFGPVVAVNAFDDFDEAVAEANRLPYGLAGYAYTRSAQTSAAIGQALECGMVSINHHGLGLPETPFGGVKDSGYGSEGGTEAMEAYLNTKFITQTTQA